MKALAASDAGPLDGAHLYKGPMDFLEWPRAGCRIRCRRIARRAGILVGLFLMTAAPARCATETDVSRPDAGGPPTPVQINLYLADLHDISGSDQIFMADVIVLAEWQDPRLAGRWPNHTGVDLDAVWHPRLQVVNQRGVNPLLPRRVEVDPSGHVLYRQRFSGLFSTRMDLRDFPLDRQTFGVQVVCLGYPRSEVDLTLPPESARYSRAKELSVPDWSIGPARLEAADYAPGPDFPPLAGVRLSWEGARHVRYYAVEVILPLIMIVLMAWIALWVSPEVVTPRMSIAVTTMLTLIAYRFALGGQIPKLTYLTRFDYFTMESTALVFLLLLTLGLSAYLVAQGRRQLVDRIDRWTRVVYLALFAAVCVWFWI